VPLSDEYRRERVERFRRYELEARRDARLALLRAIGEIVLWTLAGLFCLGMALHTFDVQMGWLYWWLGFIVWIGGVSGATLAAYRRGRERGDW
jgi:hypothetical protein